MNVRNDLEKKLKKIDLSSLSDEQACAINDILSKKSLSLKNKVDEVLIKSEEKYRQMFENIQAVYFETDLDGKVLEVSPSVESFSLYKRDDLIGSDVSEIYSDPSIRQEFLNKIFEKGSITNFNLNFKNKDNSIIYTTINAKLLNNLYGKPQKIIGVILNISQLRETINALQKSEERFREIFENTNDIVYTLDFEGNFTSVNPSAERLLGYKFNEMKNPNMGHYLSPGTTQIAFDNIKKKLSGEITNSIYEVEFVNKDGSYTSLEINSKIRYKNGEPSEIFGIARNITERVEANKVIKKNEEKYRMIFENAPLGIMTADTKGNIIEINSTLLQLLGSKSIGETKSINILKFPPLVESGSATSFKQCIDTGKSVIFETTYTSIWGNTLNAKIYTKPFKNKKGKVTSFQVIVEDITEEKISEQKLKSALIEKEILIREIHHRVKNNMQIIISLINMQMQDISDELMIRKYKELQQRVRTMSIIHEDLYMSDDLSKINFGKYLHKLSNNLLQIYSSKYEVNLKFNVSDIFLGIDIAIPFGLIVNELLTNSFKHAFTEEWFKKQKNILPEIKIDFVSTGNKYLLAISDNGVGIPDNIDELKEVSLGLMLVDILVTQLKGTLLTNNQHGTSFEIEIDK